MEFQDFKRHDTFAFESTVDLWGQKDVPLFVDISPLIRRDETLRAFLPAMEAEFRWLEGHKSLVETVLLQDGLCQLAADWMYGAQPAADEEGECYVTEKDEKVFFPITRQDFCRSLQAQSLTVFADKNQGTVSMELYLVCSPDYFAGHAIRVTVDARNQVKSHGLAG